MPYQTVTDLPDRVRHLPERAQEVYKEAFNRAWRQYNTERLGGGITRELTAHREAWTAVKTRYEKDALTGKWHIKV